MTPDLEVLTKPAVSSPSIIKEQSTKSSSNHVTDWSIFTEAVFLWNDQTGVGSNNSLCLNLLHP